MSYEPETDSWGQLIEWVKDLIEAAFVVATTIITIGCFIAWWVK